MRTTLPFSILTLALIPMAAFAQVVTTGTSVQTSPTGTTTTVTTANGPAATQQEAQAQSAEISAITSAYNSSGITPGATAGTNAGTEEAGLLVAAAINAAANEILNVPYLKARVNDPKKLIVIIAGNTGLDLSAWATFHMQVEMLTKQLDTDLKNYKAAEQVLQAKVAREHVELNTVVLAAGVLLDIAGKVASYVGTNYQLSGISVTTTDYMLAVAIASRDPRASIIYSQMLALGAGKNIENQILPLATDVVQANAIVAAGNPMTTAEKTKNPAGSQKIDAAIGALKNDIAVYNTLQSWLFGTISGSSFLPGNLGSVIQEYVAYQALTNGGAVLYVQIHDAAGGIITKTNFLTEFGADSIFASGGVVVSFAAYAKSESGSEKTALEVALGDTNDVYPMQAAGLFGVATPYLSYDNVPKILMLDKEGVCDKVTAQYPPGGTQGSDSGGPKASQISEGPKQTDSSTARDTKEAEDSCPH